MHTSLDRQRPSCLVSEEDCNSLRRAYFSAGTKGAYAAVEKLQGEATWFFLLWRRGTKREDRIGIQAGTPRNVGTPDAWSRGEAKDVAPLLALAAISHRYVRRASPPASLIRRLSSLIQPLPHSLVHFPCPCAHPIHSPPLAMKRDTSEKEGRPVRAGCSRRLRARDFLAAMRRRGGIIVAGGIKLEWLDRGEQSPESLFINTWGGRPSRW